MGVWVYSSFGSGFGILSYRIASNRMVFCGRGIVWRLAMAMVMVTGLWLWLWLWGYGSWVMDMVWMWLWIVDCGYVAMWRRSHYIQIDLEEDKTRGDERLI